MKPRSSIVTCLALGALASVGCALETSGEDIAVATEPLVVNSQFEIPEFVSNETNVVSRGTDCLDAFTLANSGTIEHHQYRGANGWAPTSNLGPPSSGVAFSGFTAVLNGGRVDLFAVGSDGKVYHKNSNVITTCITTTGLAWNGWTQFANSSALVSSGRDTITAASWGPGRLDVFWITPSRNIGHAYADNDSWGFESGDSGLEFLRAPPDVSGVGPVLEAVAPRANRVDFVYGASPFIPNSARAPIYHHFWDGTQGGWGSGASLHRTGLLLASAQLSQVVDFTLTKTTNGKFELFGLLRVNNLGHSDFHYNVGVASFDANTGWAGISGSNVPVTSLFSAGGSAFPTLVPGTESLPSLNFNSAIRWNGSGAVHRDVFSTFNKHYYLISTQ